MLSWVREYAVYVRKIFNMAATRAHRLGKVDNKALCQVVVSSGIVDLSVYSRNRVMPGATKAGQERPLQRWMDVEPTHPDEEMRPDPRKLRTHSSG